MNARWFSSLLLAVMLAVWSTVANSQDLPLLQDTMLCAVDVNTGDILTCACGSAETERLGSAGGGPVAQVKGPFRFTNNTGKMVYELRVTFAKTGGSLKNPQVLVGGGIASTPFPPGNQVVIRWSNGLPNGGQVEFTVETDCDAEVVSEQWRTTP